MFILFIVLCIPDCDEENKFRTIVLGVCLLILTGGLVIILIIYLHAYFKIIREIPKEDEMKRNCERQLELSKQADVRIGRESERQWISDYFRLVELSKVIIKKAETAQGGEKKETMVTREIESKEQVNHDTLEKLLRHYNEQIDKYLTRKKDV
jgi:hypothetical protein